MHEEPSLTQVSPPPESGRTVWIRRALITAGVVLLFVIVILLIRHLIVSKTTYRAWLIGTSRNCLVRVDTLSGVLTNITCRQDYAGTGSIPWEFQSGITDNDNAHYYATYHHSVNGVQRCSLAKFDIHSGDLLATIDLPEYVLNFTEIQINPVTEYTRLVGIALFTHQDAGTLNEGIAVLEWRPNEQTFELVADWGVHPHPTLGACCQEGPHKLCFPQAGLQPVGDHGLYIFPQCKKLYEWDTSNGNETTANFDYTVSLINYSEKLDALLAIAMMPIPARPGRKQADVATIENNVMTQENVLIHNLEYIRVPLETSLDDEKGRLYVLLGVPAKDGQTATQLRVYAVDLSESKHFELVTVSDLNPALVYPSSISNICYQKDYEG